jgi:RHS repeat-associated protein
MLPLYWSRPHVGRLLLAFLLLAGTAASTRAQTSPPDEGLVADSTELRVLRDFYAATGGPRWDNSTNWLTGTTLADASTWAGVRVERGDVTGLQAANNHLVGPVPAGLGQLTELRRLALYNNLLTGPLPVALTNLAKLELLALSGNQLTGALPAGVGRWHRLQELNLGGNAFSGQLPNELGRLSELFYLSVSNNGFSGPLPDSLARLGRLTVLDLAVNQFTGPLPAGLGQLGQLENLQLWQNSFNDSIPAAWGGMRSLRRLNMNQAHVLGRLPKELGQWTRLESIGMYGNALSGSLPAELANWRAVLEIDFSANALTGPMPAALGHLAQLQSFDAGDNQLTGPLPDSLGRLVHLYRLGLANNRLDGPIPASWKGLRALGTLDLRHNTLSGAVPDSLHAAYLLLDHNRLTALPTSYASAPGLVQLLLHDNELTALPSFLAHPAQPNLVVWGTNNVLDFAAYEANQYPAQRGTPGLGWGYIDNGQRPPAPADTLERAAGTAAVLNGAIGGAQNHYQWQRQDAGRGWVDLLGQTQPTLEWAALTPGDAGSYRTRVTNDWVRQVTLYSRTLPVRVNRTLTYVPPSNPSDDRNRNWAIERTYDGTGNAPVNVLAEAKQFTDGLGRATQAQARGRANPHVFASETIYDQAGQPVLQTLAAPINNQAFAYKEGFTAITDATGNAIEYGTVNFENTATGAPDGLNVQDPGTLGYYYSTANEWEPLTPATAYPFSLTVPAKGPLGGLTRAGGPGEAFRVGSGHDVKGHEIPLLKEFDHYLALRHHFVAGNILVTLQRQGSKSISVDADGRESIVVSNKEGQALVSCLTGPQYQPTTIDGFVSTNPSTEYDAAAPAFLDIHIPATGEHELKFTLGGQVRVRNLNDAGGVRLAGTSTYLDSADVVVNPGHPSATTATSVFLQPGFYRLSSRPSTVAAEQNQYFRYTAEYGNFSYTYYDDAGRVVATVAPNGLDNRNAAAVNSGASANLVGTWAFDEGNGTVAGDGSGGGNAGTLVNAPEWNSPARTEAIPPSPGGGDYLVFNGTNYVRVGDTPALRMSGTVSFEAWIYPTSNRGGIILNKENEYEMARFADGSIRWAFYNTKPGWAWVPTGITAPLKTWSHVAITYDNGVVTAYLNGTQTGQVFAGTGTIVPHGGEFWIGGRQGGGERFYGAIDKVRVYNTVHPPNASSGTIAGLVGEWSFDEGSGTVTSDGSGSGNTGTLINQPAWGNSILPVRIPPSPAGGSCLVFDGTSYVQVGNPPALRLNTTMSMEAWIYPTANQDGIILNKENEYEMQRFADGSIQCAFQNSSPGWAWINTGVSAPLNTWSHIAITYDNGVVTTYLNGKQAGTVVQGTGAISSAFGGEFWIGARSCCGYYFLGAIDEVHVWNTVHPPARSVALPTAVTQPQFVTRNTYDTSSRLLASESNDEGRSEYVYARDGRIRFSQSALQRSAGRFSYSNYDEQGRVVESGEYSPSQDVVFQSQLPLRTIFEAEDASYISSDVSNFYAGAHGTQRQYVQNLNVAPASGAVYGSAVQFPVTGVSSAGTYPVNLRYSAGFSSTRTMSVWANGAKVQQVFFPATGGWDVWDVVTVALPLRAGANVISIQYEADDNGAINLDYLEVVAEQTASSTSVLNLLEERAPTNSLLAANCRQRSFVTYDQIFTAAGTKPEPLLTGRTQEFTNGAVTKTWNDKVTTWYSYDELGRVTWMVQNITGVGAKTLDYTYDLAGNVLEVAYQQGQPDAFHHYYQYDEAQRLYKVYTSPDGTARTLQAKYVYYLHGPLKRVELANGLQGVDYTYTLQGWLKGINHVNGRLDPGSDSPTNNGVAKDLFGLTLDYFSGDYQSRARATLNLAGASTPASPFRYDGTIRTVSWRAGSAPAHQSVYDYDVKSQLSESAFGELAIAGAPKASTYQVTPTQNYKEGGLGYDLNGNIQSLRRTNQNGATTDNFNYEYTAGTNRLAAVHGGGSASGTSVMDYDYDAVGQMTRQHDEQGQRYYTYDVTGKTTGVYLDAAHTQPVVEFAYDDRGFRVSKKSYGTGFDVGHTNTTYYVRDASGNVLSVYKQGWQTGNLLQRSEAPLYGAGRIGVLTRLDDSTAVSADDARYELNDHLGNARVVFHRPTTVTTTASCELTNGQEDSQWLGMAQARQYAGAGAHQGVTTPSEYVAHIAPSAAGGSTAGPYHNAYVERGDTLTFSAWIRLTPVPIVVGGGGAARLQLVPVLTTGPDPATSMEAGPTARPNLFSRLTGGIALVGWGSHKTVAPPTASLTTGALTRVWLRYRVFDENHNQVAEQYTYQDNATAYTWQQLQTAVRVQQGGRVEVAVGTDDPGYDVAFDDLRLEQTGGLIVQEQHQYAYGSPLVGLNYAVGNKRYRYGYQGQFAEKDAETGFESFELRLYNDRIGRWTSNDPYGQFNSPYVGMGNNPVSIVDPNGGTGVPVNIGTSRTMMNKLIDTYLLSTCNLANVTVAGSRLASIGLQSLYYAGKGAESYARYANGTFQGEERALKNAGHFVAGLGWGENHSYQQLKQGVDGFGQVMLASPSEKIQMMVQAGKTAGQYLMNVPDMTPEELGDDIGYAGASYALTEVGIGAVKLPLYRLNGGYGLALGDTQLMYSVQKVGYRALTPFAYSSESLIIRIEKDVIQNGTKPVWHLHYAERTPGMSSRAFNRAGKVHRSISKSNFGAPIGHN